MSLLIKRQAASKLSEIIIDDDKDWAALGMINVKELVASMAKGDIVFYDGIELEKLSPGPIGSMLTTRESGYNPTWSY